MQPYALPNPTSPPSCFVRCTDAYDCYFSCAAVQTLISYLHAWGIANNDIILEPLLRPHNQHYSGAIFQVHLVDEAETGVTSLVAVGMPQLAA